MCASDVRITVPKWHFEREIVLDGKEGKEYATYHIQVGVCTHVYICTGLHMLVSSSL